jgi:hypothetical protein
MDRRRLVLALGIAEWSNALTHLDAMHAQGLVVPGEVVRCIGRELAHLIWQWPAPAGTSADAVIAEARRYVTENVADVDSVTG